MPGNDTKRLQTNDWWITDDRYREGDSSKTVSKPVTAAFGAFAGACSVYGNTPIDVVKTRMQGLEAKKYKNTINCAYQILKNEGFFA